MIRASCYFAFSALLVALPFAAPVRAVNIQIDYTYDSNNFFSVGSQARATVESVAAFYSGILDDTFSEVKTPPKFQGSFGGEVTWNWTQKFANPTTGAQEAILNPTIPADAFIIYVGAANLAGNTLGVGGPGSYSWSRSATNGGFTAAETTQWQNIDNAFVSAVTMRQETSGFGSWGGVFTIDTTFSGGLSWHFDHTTLPANNTKVDLYSVAVHEIGHALGLGNVAPVGQPKTPWQLQLNDGTTHFIGPEAVSVFGGPVPLNANDDHWVNGTASVTFNGFVPQEASMDPNITNGTRKHLTLLDAAALVDIGWEIDLPTPPAVLAGDYNDDGRVDAADYTLWRNNLNDSTEADINFAGNGSGVTNADYTWWKDRYGNTAPGAGGLAGLGVGVPEPTTLLLAMMGALFAATRRTRNVRGGTP